MESQVIYSHYKVITTKYLKKNTRCLIIFNGQHKEGLEATERVVHGSEKAIFTHSMPAPKDMVHMSLWRQFKATMTFCGHC